MLINYILWAKYWTKSV